MKKNIVITAGVAGIGRAIADTYLANGDNVAVCDVDEKSVEEFLLAHPQAIAVVADVTSETDMENFLSTVEQQWGVVDVVCANAGTGGPAGNIENLDYEDWQNCVATNLHGSFLLCRWAARLMRSRGEGLIVLTSSTAGLLGYPLRSPYAAAKWAVIGLMKTLAMELGPAGIRVNAICPGAVEGPRMDKVIANEALARGLSEEDVRASYVTGVSMKTWVKAEDIANMVFFLSSKEGSKISGQALSVDGNTETLAP